MAMIDYGAILMIDGKKYNDTMFMETSDCGFVPEKAYSKEYNQWLDIKGNYFVYAGDDNFMLVFYKTWAYVITAGEIIYSAPFNMNYPGLTRYFDGLPTVTFEHLDKNRYEEYLTDVDDDDYRYYISRYGIKRGTLYYYRALKRCERAKWLCYTNRYVARWEYQGRKYEVIYGYGVDPDKECWERIRDEAYDFTEIEKQKIDRCFE